MGPTIVASLSICFYTDGEKLASTGPAVIPSLALDRISITNDIAGLPLGADLVVSI